MWPAPSDAAAILRTSDGELQLSGRWTAVHIGELESQIEKLLSLHGQTKTRAAVDASNIQALDTVGAWILQALVKRLSAQAETAALQGLTPRLTKLMENAVGLRPALTPGAAHPEHPPPSAVENVGRWWVNGMGNVIEQAGAMLAFIGESAFTVWGCVTHPRRIRWRAVVFNIRSAGVDALPIVGLLAFLLGVVVAYQSADQLRQYGANIFVADLIGVSMLREFAPLITAIIIAGRSGSAYAAQIGTMAVTEEIDAMRTLGLSPQEMLVLPKLLAMLIVMPLLTVFADVLGVFGGMVLARAQLGVGFPEFTDRLVNAVGMSTYLVGIAKAPIFGVIIVTVGCFQGFRTKGGADSVGRQTTRSVVQSIFMVIVADAVFSVIFSALNL